MKKFFLLLFSAMMLGTNVSAQTLVPLIICIEDDEQPGGNGNPKTPITVPKVYIEDYTLSFGINHPEYVLIIKDENDNVVYTTTVYSAQTEIILPSTLSGDYHIYLVMGNWLFTGWINL